MMSLGAASRFGPPQWWSNSNSSRCAATAAITDFAAAFLLSSVEAARIQRTITPEYMCQGCAYQADSANGANLLTITGGHTIDALCYCLGEFRELAAFVVSQRDRIPVEETGELIANTAPGQHIVNGIVGDGPVVSFQIRGGMNRGTAFLFEIHGEEGDQ